MTPAAMTTSRTDGDDEALIDGIIYSTEVTTDTEDWTISYHPKPSRVTCLPFLTPANKAQKIV
jgi:hypothetical protein